MRHQMILDNGRTGQRYTLILENDQGQWQACWYVTLCGEPPGTRPAGTVVSADAYEAFVKARNLIEEADEDVAGVDWQFEEPLPPWFFE